MSILEGLTVVSIEQAVAAPFASRQLADLGARVIKIERPGGGDFARDYDDTVRGLSSHFVWLNRSKESVAVDLKSELGQRAIQAILQGADVLIHNLAPGAAERLGLGAHQVRTTHPALIYASISGYGGGGPYSAKKAYDLLIQCEAGLLSVTGTPAEPVKVGISLADIAAGMYTYTAVLAALLRRQQTGEGATIEISMLEALAEWMGHPLNYATFGGTPPPRSGARHASIAPYGPFACARHSTVFLGIQNEREWSRFCEHVLARPQLVADPRFATNSARAANIEELSGLIEEAFAPFHATEVAARLDELSIANAVLRDLHGLAEHPQLLARDRWASYTSPVGSLRALVPPMNISGHNLPLGAVPAVGEHTEQVLAEFGIRNADSS